MKINKTITILTTVCTASFLGLCSPPLTASAAPLAEAVSDETDASAETAPSEDTYFGYTLNKEEKALLEELKEKMASGELESEEQIREAIADVEERLELAFTEEQKARIVTLAQSVNSLGLDPDQLLGQIQKLYEQYGSGLQENAEAIIRENITEPVKEAVVEETKSTMKEFFAKMAETVRDFFTHIFG